MAQASSKSYSSSWARSTPSLGSLRFSLVYSEYSSKTSSCLAWGYRLSLPVGYNKLFGGMSVRLDDFFVEKHVSCRGTYLS